MPFFLNMYIIKIKGKAKIPDFIQLRNDDMILLEYFSAARPLNKLRNYGLKSSDEEIISYTGITSTTFTGCIRGFSGISGYNVGISS